MASLLRHLYHLALALVVVLVGAATVPALVGLWLLLGRPRFLERVGVRWVDLLGHGVDPAWMFDEARRERRAGS